LEIVKDILFVVSGKARKTRIMYQANLSFQLIEKYLTGLVDSGLVECHDDACYLITQRGKEFLQMYHDYVQRHKRIREDIDGADKDRILLENMCFNNCTSKKFAERKEVQV